VIGGTQSVVMEDKEKKNDQKYGTLLILLEL
jgi:hypothetical protein